VFIYTYKTSVYKPGGVNMAKKTVVTLTLPKDVYDDFKELQEIVKARGISLTMSGILEESLRKYLAVFSSVIKSVKEGRDINQGDIYGMIGSIFSELSYEIKKISQSQMENKK